MWWVGMVSRVHAQRMVWCSGEGYHKMGASQHSSTSWHDYVVPSPYSPCQTAVQGWCPRCMQHLSHLLSNCTLPPGQMVQREGQIQATVKQKVKRHTQRSLSHCTAVSNTQKCIYTAFSLAKFHTNNWSAWVWMATSTLLQVCTCFVCACSTFLLTYTVANCELFIMRLQTKDLIQSPHSVVLNGLRDLTFPTLSLHGYNVQARLFYAACLQKLL